MKFYVGTKEKGEEIRRQIREIVKGDGYISAGRIDTIIFGAPVRFSAEFYGWPFEDVRKKMRLRETKNGWYLYFPQTMDLPFGDSVVDYPLESEKKEGVGPIDIPGNVQLDVLGLRTCRVVSKRKDKEITQLGFFHGWYQLKVPKTGGDSIMYPIGIVEMEDGSVKQVKPERIIFGWEE